MNIQKLYPVQWEMRERIIKEHSLEGQDLLPNLILALQVELGELANEWRGFKHWSTDREPRTKKVCSYCNGKGFHDFFDPLGEGHDTCQCGDCDGDGFIKDKNPLLEEYADCLSFILELGIELAYENAEFWGTNLDNKNNITRQFNEIYSDVSTVDFLARRAEQCIEAYEKLVAGFLSLGIILGFDYETIEQAYMEKHAINMQRQDEGY